LGGKAKISPWSTRVPRGGDGSGFTLVELMMSLVILTIGLVALAGVFLADLQIANVASSRTRAAGLATRDLEAFRGLPYCDVGYTTGAGNQVTSSTWTDGTSTYTVANPGGNPNPIEPPPSGSAVISGRTYTISRMVAWAGATGDNGGVGTAMPSAYKQVIELVTWTDRDHLSGCARSVRRQELRRLHPGGQWEPPERGDRADRQP
jgi:prepilin-type N-terminal cleavage/methylation domain-containing protein